VGGGRSSGERWPGSVLAIVKRACVVASSMADNVALTLPTAVLSRGALQLVQFLRFPSTLALSFFPGASKERS